MTPERSPPERERGTRRCPAAASVGSRRPSGCRRRPAACRRHRRLLTRTEPLQVVDSIPESEAALRQRVYHGATLREYEPRGNSVAGDHVNGYDICSAILQDKNVPSTVIDEAVNAPSMIRGWMRLANQNVPYHPVDNPYRRSLTVRYSGLPYHRLFNGLEFKPGCQ